MALSEIHKTFENEPKGFRPQRKLFSPLFEIFFLMFVFGFFLGALSVLNVYTWMLLGYMDLIRDRSRRKPAMDLQGVLDMENNYKAERAKYPHCLARLTPPPHRERIQQALFHLTSNRKHFQTDLQINFYLLDFTQSVHPCQLIHID